MDRKSIQQTIEPKTTDNNEDSDKRLYKKEIRFIQDIKKNAVEQKLKNQGELKRTENERIKLCPLKN